MTEVKTYRWEDLFGLLDPIRVECVAGDRKGQVLRLHWMGPPRVGESFKAIHPPEKSTEKEMLRTFMTSRVEQIEAQGWGHWRIRTQNSTYSILTVNSEEDGA